MQTPKTPRLSGTIAIAIICLSSAANAGDITGTPSAQYPDVFVPTGTLTVDPDNGLLNVLSTGGTAGPVRTGHWNLSAEGGISISLLGLGLLESGTQIEIDGDSLNFGVGNVDPALLAQLGTNLYQANWLADLVLDDFGNEVALMPNSTYTVTFDIDGTDGLLDSTLLVDSEVSLSLLGGDGNPIGDVNGSTLIDLLGLFGNGATSGTASFTFETGGSVAPGPITLRFEASASLDATILGIGEQFLEVSNLIMVENPPVPSGTISAGVDLTIDINVSTELVGIATGVPDSVQWSVVSGNALTVSFDTPNSLTTNVLITAPGSYTIQLTGFFGGVPVSDTMNCVVEPAIVVDPDGPGLSYRPDNTIGKKRSRPSHRGNDIYNVNSRGQKIRLNSKGRTIKFYFTVENNGSAPDRITSRASGISRSRFQANYRDLTGGRNVTSKMINTKYVKNYQPGEVRLFRAKLKPKKGVAGAIRVNAKVLSLSGQSGLRDRVSAELKFGGNK